jgi:hypothetical protein
MISVMAILGRNYIRQTTGSRGNAVVDKSPVQQFQVIFTAHLPTDIIKCLQEMLVQFVPMELCTKCSCGGHGVTGIS